MKNQYFGDITDYRKYGLLRILAGSGDLKSCVCWMLTRDDSKTDGTKTQYLQQRDKYRQFDPPLFDFLHEHVVINKTRDVSIVGNSSIIPSTRFYSKYLDDNREVRHHYIADFFRFSKGCDLVFFDPDNGIEVKSVEYGKKGSSKYIYWPEIIYTYERGQSCLIYQHFPRESRAEYIESQAKELAMRARCEMIFLFSTSKMLFLLASRKQDKEHFKSCSSVISKVWKGQIKVSVLRREFILEHF